MKNFYLQIPKVFLLVYTIFSLATLSHCTKDSGEYSALEKIKNANTLKLQILSDEFDAVHFDCSSISSILNKNIVLDTLLIGMQKQKDCYLLKAKVKCDSQKEIFAELKCTKEIYQQYERTKSNNLLIAAKIISYAETNILADVDSLSERKKQIDLGKTILFSGECLALLENTYYGSTN